MAIAQTEEGLPALLDVVTSPLLTPFSCRRGSRAVDAPSQATRATRLPYA
jgi:hypothetical protein